MLNSKKININSKNKIFNKEIFRSNIKLNNDISLSNYSNFGINSLLKYKIKSIDSTNSRNFDHIEYNTNSNLNKNRIKTNENIKINLTKNTPNKSRNDSIKNNFFKINKNQKTIDINKRKFEIKKNTRGLIKEKNKFFISKINTKYDLRNNLFQNETIKKKENNKQINLINNSKKYIPILTTKKTHDNLNSKNYFRKIPFYFNKRKTLNPFENDNQNKVKKIGAKVITLENIYYTQSNISDN